jgi:hypothetical protein
MLARSFGKESAYHAYIINNKLKTLQRYDTAKNYIILHRVIQRLSQHNLEISHHCNIKNLVKQNKNSNITRRYVRDPSWGSSVSVVSDYRLDERASIPGRGNGVFL